MGGVDRVELGRRVFGGVSGGRGLPVGRREDVLDRHVRALAGVGLSEAATGSLDLAYLLRKRTLRVGLRVEVAAVADQGHLEIALEGADFATRGAPRLALLHTGVRVPGRSEGAVVGAAAIAVRGEHRADAAALVDVRADDHAVGADAAEHCLLRAGGHCVDGVSEPPGVVAAFAHYQSGCPSGSPAGHPRTKGYRVGLGSAQWAVQMERCGCWSLPSATPDTRSRPSRSRASWGDGGTGCWLRPGRGGDMRSRARGWRSPAHRSTRSIRRPVLTRRTDRRPLPPLARSLG